MNNKGFTLIEVLIASTIIVTMITIFVPITTLLNYERKALSDRRTLSAHLHDELQPYLWSDSPVVPKTSTKIINSTSINLHFSYEGKLIKGCVIWKNVKEKTETICLYGYPKK